MSSPSSPSHAKIPFLAFMHDPADVQVLKAFAIGKGWSEACVQVGDIGTATEVLRQAAPPGILIVELMAQEGAEEKLNALADVCDPDTKVVVAGNINEYSFYCWLTEIGIFNYLLRPVTAHALEAIWAKATEPPPAPPGKAERKPGRVIGITGTRGGVGATSLSVFLATMLAGRPDQKVALVDLDPQDGSISLLLDLEPSRGFREALEKPERIDNMFLDRVAHKSAQGVSVLSAEEALHERIHFHDAAADTLLSAMKAKYDIILLDLPRTNHPFYRACAKACENILLVSDPSLQGLRDGLRLADFYRDHLKLKPPVFVVNRVGMSKHEMSLADFSKGLNNKVDFQIPFAPEIFMEIGADMAPLKKNSAPAVKVLQKLIDVISPGDPADKDGKTPPPSPKLGFLKKGK